MVQSEYQEHTKGPLKCKEFDSTVNIRQGILGYTFRLW